MAWRSGAVAMMATALIGAAPAPAPQIEAHVRFLADDLLEGRGTGTRGHEIAARYVAAQLAALGVRPAAGEGGWFQRIAFDERSFAGTRETLTLLGRGKPVVLVNGGDATFGPAETAGTDRVEGELVFAGFGLKSERLGVDDYAGLDLAGKVAVVLSGSPTTMDSEIGAHLARSKAGAARAAGAIGVITVRTRASAGQREWPRVASTARLPRRGWLTPDGKPGGEGAGLRFNAGVSEAAAAMLFEGATRSLTAVLDEAANGAPKGFVLPGRVRIDRSTSVKRLTSPNVIGVLPGTSRADELVLVMAHLDHMGVREGNAGDKIYNGAMDNAAGVAIMLDTARRLAASKRLPRSVLFMATTAEEGGLLGAEYFAAHPPLALNRVVAAVNLDMPILTCDAADVIAYGAARSTLAPIVAAAARESDLVSSPDPQPIEAIFTRSDHYPLIKAGIPAVFLKTGWRDRRGGMACREADQSFRRDHYHEPSDDMSRAFDWVAAERFAAVNTGITRRIATARERPRWLEGDFFGESFAAPDVKSR